MSPAAQADRSGPRAGVSLLELLVVLAIMGLAMAVLMPSGSRMLDQATAHAVFFELQREISAARRDAARSGEAIVVEGRAEPGREATPEAAEDEPRRLRIPLPASWTYTVAPDLVISDGGACGPADVRLYRDDEEVMHLRIEDATCRLTRLR